MEKKVGVWIDHRKAVVVSKIDDRQEIKMINSGIERHPRFSGGAQEETEEDIRDHRFENHLNKYYDDVISFFRGAGSIFIIGPGEAKIELKNRLGAETEKSRVIDIETADKMTETQIISKITEHFSL